MKLTRNTISKILIAAAFLLLFLNPDEESATFYRDILLTKVPCIILGAIAFKLTPRPTI